jgi:gp16 family phage-associated protein
MARHIGIAPFGPPGKLTGDQVKAKFEAQGKSIAGWAREHQYPLIEVYKVVGGFSKAKRGRGHEIAVKLGMKAAQVQA